MLIRSVQMFLLGSSMAGLLVCLIDVKAEYVWIISALMVIGLGVIKPSA